MNVARLGLPRRKQIPFVAQQEHAACGAACLAMVLRYHGRHVELRELRAELGVGRDGCDALTLLETAERHGLTGRGVAIDVGALDRLPPGSILHWQFNHFVVLERCTARGVIVLDPARGRRTLDREGVRRCFTGVAIWLERGATFERRAAVRTHGIGYAARLLRERAAFARILAASVVGRFLALVVPILTGIVVDHVIPRGDEQLLVVVAAGVLFVVAFQLIAQLVRGLLLLELRTRVDSDMVLGFLGHMLSLPYEFFQRRQTGDLVMRVGSHTQLREQITVTGLAAVLDGGFACAYLAVVALVSPMLSAIIAGLATIQILLLLGSRRRIAELGTQTVEARSRASARLVQMIAGIEPLKLCGAERRSIASWSNDYVDELNASLAEGRTALWIEAVMGALRTLSPLLLLSFGTIMVIRGEISLGAMLAVNALGLSVLGPVSSLVDALMRLGALRGHFERIEEVRTEPPERAGGHTELCARGAGLVVRDLTFTYPGRNRPALDGVSLEVPSASCIAIVGPSGSGKSTLARMLVGFCAPDAGEIEIDGRRISELDLRALRRRVGVVPQRPYLFAGTIADNIALGAPGASRARVRAAAELAGIHDEIESWPLAYDTPVSEDGGTLSGGQRKRVALARALLCDPKVLVLDEATSDLDTLAEATLTRNLDGLHCTRIVIAHRLSTVATADRIYVLDEGRIVEFGTASELVAAHGVFARLARAQDLARPEAFA